MIRKLLACSIALGAALLPSPSRALSNSDLELMQSQLDDLEDDMLDRRSERMQRETDRRRREQEAAMRQDREAHERWMSRCTRDGYCPLPAARPAAMPQAVGQPRAGDRWELPRAANMEYCMREWHDLQRCNTLVDKGVDPVACSRDRAACVPIR